MIHYDRAFSREECRAAAAAALIDYLRKHPVNIVLAMRATKGHARFSCTLGDAHGTGEFERGDSAETQYRNSDAGVAQW